MLVPLLLANRANQFLLSVLRLRGSHAPEIPLPPLSPTFIASQGLQAAVFAGILNTGVDNPALSAPTFMDQRGYMGGAVTYRAWSRGPGR